MLGKKDLEVRQRYSYHGVFPPKEIECWNVKGNGLKKNLSCGNRAKQFASCSLLSYLENLVDFIKVFKSFPAKHNIHCYFRGSFCCEDFTSISTLLIPNKWFLPKQ